MPRPALADVKNVLGNFLEYRAGTLQRTCVTPDRQRPGAAGFRTTEDGGVQKMEHPSRLRFSEKRRAEGRVGGTHVYDHYVLRRELGEEVLVFRRPEPFLWVRADREE